MARPWERFDYQLNFAWEVGRRRRFARRARKEIRTEEPRDACFASSFLMLDDPKHNFDIRYGHRLYCCSQEQARIYATIKCMAIEFTTSYLKDSLALFRQYKKLAEGAMAQATDAQLYVTLDSEANSIALLVKHMAGNMRSRWTDFLTADGEKPDRHRDSEFVEDRKSVCRERV